VPLDGIVERQESRVAELENRDGGEALGHRRDAKHAPRVDGGARRHLANARRPDVDDLSIDDDPVGDARHPCALGEPPHELVNLGESRGELREALRVGESCRRGGARGGARLRVK
jgi:hypothetical protein